MFDDPHAEEKFKEVNEAILNFQMVKNVLTMTVKW